MDRREGHPHRADHMRRLQRARRAGRTGRGADPQIAHVVDDRLALDVLKAHVAGVGQPMGGIAVHAHVRAGRQQPLFQLVAQRPHLGRLARHIRRRQFARLGQPDDIGHILRPAPAAALLMPAEHEGLQARPAPQVEDPDSLRSVEFVAGHREHVHRNLAHVHGDLPRHLDGIGMDHRARLFRQRRDLRDREDDAGLVVRPHDAHQFGTVPLQRLPEGVHIQIPAAVHRQFDLPATHILEAAARSQDGGVLHPGGDDPRLGPQHLRAPVDGHVVALGRAAGEDDLRWIRMDERRDLLPRPLDVLRHLPAERMHAGGIAVKFVKKRHHRIPDFRGNPRCRVVVKINRIHRLHSLKEGYSVDQTPRRIKPPIPRSRPCSPPSGHKPRDCTSVRRRWRES